MYSYFVLRTLVSLAVAAATLLFLPKPSEAQEQCLSDAWEAFNGNDYLAAIRFADRCIDDFGQAAGRMQSSLLADGRPEPGTGAVSDAERNGIFQRGLLNDVATAYFIKGRSAEYLFQARSSDAAERRAEAEMAYGQACEVSYGRTWDPRGWFWSPCEAAGDRLPLPTAPNASVGAEIPN